MVAHMVKNKDQLQYPLKTNRQLEKREIEKPLFIAKVGVMQSVQAITQTGLGQKPFLLQQKPGSAE